MPLPIEPYLPEIVRTIESNTLTLVEAEPGAGKTTRIPAALLQAGMPHVMVLEPRRLAARLAARRVAEELGSTLGGLAGFQVRFERVGGAETRLWFVTEGVLTQWLLSRGHSGKHAPKGPLPEGTVVLLDEFHERHLDSDLSLALLRDLQRKRSDLRLVLMSATLGGEALAQQLGTQAPVLQIPGRVFPVDVEYTGASALALPQQVAQAVSKALRSTTGHVLVFLPGAAEIRASLDACRSTAGTTARLLPLYGELKAEEQDAAVAPSKERRVIFATNIAESSITIEGVTAVVDSGLARMASYSPLTGFTRLQVGRVSRASCVQRAGRAGRTGPGLAIRLYSAEDFARRPEQGEIELRRADLARAVLQLAVAGQKPEELPWLEVPKSAALAQGRQVLTDLGALTSEGEATAFGRKVTELPVHPRLAALVYRGVEYGAATEAIQLAALLDEGRVRLGEEARHRHTSDVDALLDVELGYAARQTASRLRNVAREAAATPRPDALQRAILQAFPDRVGKRSGETVLFAGGGSARIDRTSCTRSDFLIALDADERSEVGQPVVRLAAPVEPDFILDAFPERVEAREELRWDRREQRLEQVQALRYGDINIDEMVSKPPPSEEASTRLLEGARAANWNPEGNEDVQAFLERLRFAAPFTTKLPAAEAAMDAALQTVAAGKTSLAELKLAERNGELMAALQGVVDMRLLNELAPTHYAMPNGRRARIEYAPGQPPTLSSRLQDFIGMKQSPSVAGGAVPLTLSLLAPSGRPVQVTTDLRSFWANLYPQLRRELSRRYPRHSWPENP